jgi:hypothetical protein
MSLFKKALGEAVGDTAEKLLDLQKKVKELEAENPNVKTQHNHLISSEVSNLDTDISV